MKQFLSTGFLMKISATSFITVLIFASSSFNCRAFSIIPSHADFSGCTMPTHQRAGSLTAKNANLKSVETSGTTDLENTIVTGHLDATGKLTCKDCTLGSLTKTGRGILYNTTIHSAFSSTNDTRANTCTFESYSGLGETDFEKVEVTGSIKNTGNLKATNTNCDTLNVTGSVRLKNFSCSNINITGRTTLTDTAVKRSAQIIGAAKVYSSSFNTLQIIGKTLLSNVTAVTFEIVGRLDATNADGDTLTIASNAASLRECAIKNLYVKKQQSPTTITIYNSPQTAERCVARIVCEDPATKIVYEKDSIRAQEIVGTANVTA